MNVDKWCNTGDARFRALAGEADPAGAPRRSPEAPAHGGIAIRLFPRDLLPLAATVARTLPRRRQGAESAGRRRSAHREFWHLARRRGPAHLGRERSGRSVARTVHGGPSPPDQQRVSRYLRRAPESDQAGSGGSDRRGISRRAERRRAPFCPGGAAPMAADDVPPQAASTRAFLGADGV